MTGCNGWDKTLEGLLGNWSQQITINEEALKKRSSTLLHWYWAIGIMIIVAQAGSIGILGAVIAAAVSDGSGKIDVGPIVFVAIMELLVSITQGCDKFFNLGSASEKYAESSTEYSSLSLLIDSILAMPRKNREVAHEAIVSIRKQFLLLKKRTPYLPHNKVVHRLELCIYEDPEKARGKKGKDIINIDQSFGLLAKRESSPQKTEAVINIPQEKTKPVDLPSPPGPTVNQQLVLTFREEPDPDEEIVTNTNHLDFQTKLQEQKNKADQKITENKSRTMNIFNYQWSRMQEHDEDDHQLLKEVVVDSKPKPKPKVHKQRTKDHIKRTTR